MGTRKHAIHFASYLNLILFIKEHFICPFWSVFSKKPRESADDTSGFSGFVMELLNVYIINGLKTFTA
jgi:hypothetical protein